MSGFNIPTSVRVGSLSYIIEWDNRGLDSRRNMGECETVNTTIRIDPILPAGRKQQTFLHELLEAINYEYHVNLKHGQVELLTLALHQVIVDNPEMFVRPHKCCVGYKDNDSTISPTTGITGDVNALSEGADMAVHACEPNSVGITESGTQGIAVGRPLPVSGMGEAGN